MTDDDRGDEFEPEEAQRRFEKALRAGLKMPPPKRADLGKKRPQPQSKRDKK